ncbi:MAG: MFS transporter [Clostridia bacterium]|nr:MFS transporter [Clostridia bacterium]
MSEKRHLQESKRLSFKDKIGYASASFGDAAAYSLIGSFLIFFLTTVVGIDPATAGFLAAMGSVANAVINPIIGFISDNLFTKYGKRRPLIFLMTFPLALGMFLCFTSFDFAENTKPLYYGFMVIVYWCAYTAYFVPYQTLGAEYTNDYDERTRLRSYASFFNMIGTLCAMVLPPMIVEFLEKAGFSTGRAWSITALAIAILTTASILLTVLFSKDKDVCTQEEIDRPWKKLKADDLVKNYIQLFELKPMRAMIGASTAFLIGYVFVISGMVYYMTYNYGMSGTEISTTLLFRTVAGALMIPIVNKATIYLGKKRSLIFFEILAACCFLLCFIAKSNTFMLYFFILGTVWFASIYWQLVPSMYYDICEYDMAKNGKDRKGQIVSFQGLTEALSMAIGSAVFGVLLDFGGFDGEKAVQSVETLATIKSVITVGVIVTIILGIIALSFYEISKESFKKIKNMV